MSPRQSNLSASLLAALLVGGAAAHSVSLEAREWEHGLHSIVTPSELTSRRTKDAVPAVAGELSNIQWLHIPKTGTSFIATIWSYACGQGDMPLDLGVDPAASPHCLACYDFALLDRYPEARYCQDGVLHRLFQTQHRPVQAQLLTGEDAQSLLGLFRSPNQRIMSAYNDNLHASGFSREAISTMFRDCRGRGPSCYANYPGIAGCATRMLTGEHCAVEGKKGDELVNITQERIQLAIERVNSMAFVGLTEEWDESVCLFHLMFGSKVYRAEFKDIHRGRNKKGADWGEDPLGDFVDEADEAVYAAAKARFEQLRSQYAGGADSACDAMFASMPKSDDLLESPPAEAQAPQSCKASGHECGRLEEVDCGSCPLRRIEFLPGIAGVSSRPRCSTEGFCQLEAPGARQLYAWEIPHTFIGGRAIVELRNQQKEDQEHMQMQQQQRQQRNSSLLQSNFEQRLRSASSQKMLRGMTE